ncbi:GNAT family N-acetyltransferase [Isoptericola croceus]|uniref:GNAT family N-acetyltransferase n=1 Tax=Isoptericola croceus TaxID=3031406 RepID=UPI0023FA49D7|nr:GNAT family N-acetyltransferase [Isoptericola croceus]
MTDAARLLAAYDEQLRTDAETPSALRVRRLGPLRLVTFTGGRGFVTYQDFGGADGAAVRELVAQAIASFRADEAFDRAEWKTRGHDHAPGLHEALVDAGFVPDEPESIMIGPAAELATVDVPLPDGVTLRRIVAEDEGRAMQAMADEVFGDPPSAGNADAMLRRQEVDPSMELWIAESGGEIIGAGRLEPVAGTQFAGVWGGSMRPQWRGRGIYRALVAARARAALAMGKSLVHSDSTEFSRPILERSGMVKVSTTTPYRWRR